MLDDPVKLAPNVYRILVENARVRVLDFRLPPGEQVGMHAHPTYCVYVLSPGRLKFTLPNGRSSVVAPPVGACFWHEAGSHAAENVGADEAHALKVELK